MSRVDELQTDGDATPPSSVVAPKEDDAAEQDAERRLEHPILREQRVRDDRAAELAERQKMIEAGEVEAWCVPENNALFVGEFDDDEED